MFDGIDFSKAIEIEGRLRFDINLLKIKYQDEWYNLPKYGEYKGIPVELSDVLFDTGNEAGYCQIISAFLDSFKKKFAQIELIPKANNLLITKEKVEFKFNKIIKFKTFIGFRSGNVPSNWINTLNIGIDSIIQFTSILYPSDTSNLKNKYICFH
ncbi:MAG: hypothetical protein ACTSPD_09615 [Promethearchaeota archaeon]